MIEAMASQQQVVHHGGRIEEFDVLKRARDAVSCNLVARQSFWTVAQTIESVGLRAAPYHAHVPSFGEWGFIIASRRPWRLPEVLPGDLRFLSTPSLPLMFDFPLDMARVPAEVNRLSNQVLVHTYEREWGKH